MCLNFEICIESVIPLPLSFEAIYRNGVNNVTVPHHAEDMQLKSII
jgi:hypothetical protein